MEAGGFGSNGGANCGRSEVYDGAVDDVSVEQQVAHRRSQEHSLRTVVKCGYSFLNDREGARSLLLHHVH